MVAYTLVKLVFIVVTDDDRRCFLRSLLLLLLRLPPYPYQNIFKRVCASSATEIQKREGKRLVSRRRLSPFVSIAASWIRPQQRGQFTFHQGATEWHSLTQWLFRCLCFSLVRWTAAVPCSFSTLQKFNEYQRSIKVSVYEHDKYCCENEIRRSLMDFAYLLRKLRDLKSNNAGDGKEKLGEVARFMEGAIHFN